MMSSFFEPVNLAPFLRSNPKLIIFFSILSTTFTSLSIVSDSHSSGLSINVPVVDTPRTVPSPTIILSLPPRVTSCIFSPLGVTWQLAPLSAIHTSYPSSVRLTSFTESINFRCDICAMEKIVCRLLVGFST